MSVQWLSQILDWDKFKLQYEVFGDSFERISETSGVPITSLRRVAQEEGWQRYMDNDESALSPYLAEMTKTARTKLRLAALSREIELFPLLMEAEFALLDKTRQAIREIDPFQVQAGTQLRALSQTINAISDRKIISLDEAEDFAGADATTWSVEIKPAKPDLQLVSVDQGLQAQVQEL